MLKTFITILLGLLLSNVSAQTKTITFQEVSTGFGIYFGADITTTTITVTVKGPDNRWFAVGFGATNMFGTDALIYTTGKFNADPQNAYDYYLTAQSTAGVNKDAQQNWTISSNTTSGGERTIVASRVLNTSDASDYVFNYNATSLNLIYAKAGFATFQLANHGNGNSSFTVLTVNSPCSPPTTPTLSASNSTLCLGSSSTIGLNSGTLNNASKWYLYSGSCGGTLIDSSASGSFNVSPIVTTNFYIRGEGNCVIPGACGNITITVNNNTSSTINPVVCDSYTSPSGNYIWTISNTYMDTIPNAVSCDSVITINLTVNPSSFSTINPVVCDSYTSPSGNFTWTTSNTYLDTIANSIGCDSVITINLIVNESTTSNIFPVECDSFISPSGNYTWFTSGLYNDTVTNGTGCDSIITIDLTITNGTSATINPIVCDSFSSPSGKYVWTISGTYLDTIIGGGCQSIITINLIVNYSSSGSLSQTGCDTIIINNQIYTASGVYAQNLINSTNCDSALTLNLTINQSVLTVIDTSICQGESYEGYSITGSYFDVYTANNGCDSIRELNLNVIPTVNNDTTITIFEGDSIMLGGAYQTSPGKYFDTLQTFEGCDSIVKTILSVLVSVNELRNNQKISVFPNPTSGILYLEINNTEAIKTIRLYDIHGKEVMIFDHEQVTQTIDLSRLSIGMYFIIVETDLGIIAEKIVKK